MSFLFSTRTGWDIGESRFAAAVRAAREAGRDLIDLTVSNPTVCGYEYDIDEILRPLADFRALTYDPDPRGVRSAREAVAEYYADHGAVVDPDALLMTTSTSEGYSYLFRLLCNAGDEVLVAQPSYPLFDFLADLEDVRLRSYPLFYDFGWWIDFAELERRITPRTRAIVVVHPNNPTGHATGWAERLRLEEICARHGLALIVDEVFLDYPLALSESLVSFTWGPHPVLTFVLSGMSKVAALPQMKVGWIAACGPDDLRREALARLEVVADTFLSMNMPVQCALPLWLKGRKAIQTQILNRVRGNWTAARDGGADVFRVDAGWSAILRLAHPNRSEMAEHLFEQTGVVVHPGSFYGLAGGGRIVVSLLGPAAVFAEGISRLQAWEVVNLES